MPKKMKTDAWRGETSGSGGTRSSSQRGQHLRPIPPQNAPPPDPPHPWEEPASESGAKQGIAPLGRETSLGCLSADFFHPCFQLTVRAWGGARGEGRVEGGAAVGRRLRRRPVLKASGEISASLAPLQARAARDGPTRPGAG